MGIAIAALAVGFVLLYDIQQEQELETVWLQKIPTQCNDVWHKEYNEFYENNPDLIELSRDESKKILEGIIKNYYQKQGINVLNLILELDVYDGVRCQACSCLGWDLLSIEIPKDQQELIPEKEGWILKT